MPSESPSPSTPARQRARIADEAGLTGARPDPVLDSVAQLAARVTGAPIAVVTFVEETRQVFKGATGLLPALSASRETPLRYALCAVPLTRARPVVIADTGADALTVTHPARTVHGISAYLGVPFYDPARRPLGVVAVMDTHTRHWEPSDLEAVSALARLAESEVANRLQRVHVVSREAGVAEVQTFFEGVLDQLSVECTVWDRAHRFVYANPAAVPEAETRAWLIGRTNEDYGRRRGYPPALAQTRESVVRTVFETGETHRHAEQLPDGAGGVRHFVRIYAPVRAADGEVSHVVGSTLDLTALHEARRTAEEHETRYRLMADSSGDLIAHHRPDGTYTYVSPASYFVLGVEPEAIVGTRAVDWVHHDDRARVEAFQAAMFAGETPDVPLTARFPHADGRWVWIEAVARLVETTTGEREVVSVARDITRRMEYQQALVVAREKAEAARADAEEMARMKTAFVANMSHEIRTPLTAILGYAQILGEDLPDEYQPIVEPIVSGSQRLYETLNSVLDLARLDAGSFELQIQPVDVHARVDATLQLFGALATVGGVTLRHTGCSDAVPAVAADGPALDRVITNLVSNAVKFTPGGKVTVSCHAEGPSVVVRVADTGIGMNETFLPHVFSEFRQESIGDDREHEGSGLGLAIVKRLVEAMAGEITVESTPGVGTTFAVRLPATAAAARPAAPARRAA